MLNKNQKYILSEKLPEILILAEGVFIGYAFYIKNEFLIYIILSLVAITVLVTVVLYLFFYFEDSLLKYLFYLESRKRKIRKNLAENITEIESVSKSLQDNKVKFISPKNAKKFVLLLILIFLFDFFLFVAPELAEQAVEVAVLEESLQTLANGTTSVASLQPFVQGDNYFIELATNVLKVIKNNLIVFIFPLILLLGFLIYRFLKFLIYKIFKKIFINKIKHDT